MISKAYKLEKTEFLPDLEQEAKVYSHIKTGAKVIVFENNDENRVFCIGFKTLPEDSTGVAHILEHSVLCGSRKYPVKEPFVELLKGSFSTFLNAMTYPTKTVYPCASTNDKDFQNMMDVYLDAVFFPNIYKNPSIFYQEGWHYDFENKDAPLRYSGVVYNEMKGVYSSPSNLFFRDCYRSLFPDTQKSKDSGGNPEEIPSLTYEQFLDFHKKFYHPSNACIYLYGKLDVEEKMTYIAENYLDLFEARTDFPHLRKQKPFTKSVLHKTSYFLNQEEDVENKSYYGYNFCAENYEGEAISLILKYLCGSTVSPLTKYFIEERRMAEQMVSFRLDEGNVHSYTISLLNAVNDKAEEFEKELREQLVQQIQKGFDKKTLKGLLNQAEFAFKERDFGSTPQGLEFVLESANYAFEDMETCFKPFYLSEHYQELQRLLETNYFEELAQKYLLDNEHRSLTALIPDPKKKDETEEKLVQFKSNLSEEKLEELWQIMKNLKAFQEKEDSPEELESLPTLQKSDLSSKAKQATLEERKEGAIPVIYHAKHVKDIAYIKYFFPISAEHSPAQVALLKELLGSLSTENYTYEDLDTEIKLHTGSLSFGLESYAKPGEKLEWYLLVKTSVLSSEISSAQALIEEILFRTQWRDTERVKTLLLAIKSNLEYSIQTAGNTHAKITAAAHLSPEAYLSYYSESIGLFLEVKDLLANWEKESELFLPRLTKLLKDILVQKNSFVDFVGSEEDYQNFRPILQSFMSQLPQTGSALLSFEQTLPHAKIGVKENSQVQYVCRYGSFKSKGLPYTGRLSVLAWMITLTYLWKNVRAIGGAYGVGLLFNRNGEGFFVSYRDPHLRQTNRCYEEVLVWLKELTLSEREILKYMIGVLSVLDRPVSIYQEADQRLREYKLGISLEMKQQERDDILTCTLDDLKNCAPYLEALLASEVFCVVGNEAKIEEAKDLFEHYLSI